MPNEDEVAVGDLLTTAEVCVALSPDQPLDRSTVVRMVREHRLTPAHRLPGKTGAFLFRRADIEALAAARAEAAS